MPRALAIRYVTVTDGERSSYLARLAERVAGAQVVGAQAAAFHLWAFEQADAPGRFVEFIETRDRTALDVALRDDDLFVHGAKVEQAAMAPEGAWVCFTAIAAD